MIGQMRTTASRRIRHAARSAGILLAVLWVLLAVGCGGARPTTRAEMAPLPQPTPDPTLDAVVRGLPRPALAKAPESSVQATPAAASQASVTRAGLISAGPATAPAPAGSNTRPRP
jgi:hypothetical protein